MGEDPRQVHIVGSPGLDHLRRSALLDGPALEAALGAKLGQRNLLVTFHPVTLANDNGAGEFEEMLAALAMHDSAAGVRPTLWISRPNADTGGRAIAERLEAWVASWPGHAHVFASLGQIRYLSLMSVVDAVVGNSSSGLYEAPSFKIPTVNIGERQSGRLAAASVVHCPAERGAIALALARAVSMDCRSVVNPYGDGHSAGRIVGVLRAQHESAMQVRKTFHWV